MKQTLKTGIIVLVVAGLAMSGIALAQTSSDTPATAVEDTRAYEMIQEKLVPLVEAGTINQSQADAVAATLAAELRGPGGGRGFRAIQQVAEFLDLTPDEMKAALAEYDTLADLAAANGSSGAELITYLVAQAEEHIAQAVTDGRLTQAEADERLAGLEEHITDMVNSDIPERPMGRGPGFGRGHGVGFDGEHAGGPGADF
jgi:polyhydroxyalkanoate synthesis regulator phasin